MKIKNPFKKETKNVVKSNLEKLDKNQLEKVIGGGGGDAGSTDRKLKPGATTYGTA